MSRPDPKVVFYDVAPDGRAAIIAGLAEAAWRKARKMLILTPDPQAARALDEALWTYRDDAFLPHEVVAPGDALVDEQARVVITFGEADPLGADILVQLSPASLDFAATYRTVIDIVDHSSEERLKASRARYAAWRARGLEVEMQRR